MKKLIIPILLFIILTLNSKQTVSPNTENNSRLNDIINSSNETNTLISTETVFDEIFTFVPIPDNVCQNMLGKSIPLEYKDNVDLSSLSYLQISHYGFDGEPHIGEMIVNAKLAKDVLEIFKELYDIKYPIEKIKLIDEYDADDELSMSDNNTSCFCYRIVSGTKSLSNHAKGCAIDINPLYNPYVTSKIVSPSNATRYIDRSLNNEHMIDKNAAIYKIFIKHRLDLGRKLEI